MHINQEMFGELAEAVFGGDLAKAEVLLNELQMIGGDRLAEEIRRAKRRARPEMKVALPPLEKPFVLPAPGHLPWSTLGAPRLAGDDPIPPGVERNAAQRKGA